MKYFRHAQAGQSILKLFQFTLLAIGISLFSSMAMAEKINLNQADAETLEYIPGIGPSKSQTIIEARELMGGFKQYEDMLEIPGIGQKTLEEIKKHGLLDGGVSRLTPEMMNNPPSKEVSSSNSESVDSSG